MIREWLLKKLLKKVDDYVVEVCDIAEVSIKRQAEIKQLDGLRTHREGFRFHNEMSFGGKSFYMGE